MYLTVVSYLEKFFLHDIKDACLVVEKECQLICLSEYTYPRLV